MDAEFTDVSLEPHYTAEEIAKIWKVSPHAVLRLFKNEPGVLRFGTEESRFVRRRISLRIPRSVMVQGLRSHHRVA